MRRKDPNRKQQIIDFVNRFYEDYHRTPSIREISVELSLSKSTVHAYLMEMSEDGWIDYDGKMIVTEAMGQRFSEYNRTGVLGAVPCGQLSMEEEAVEEYVELPISIFGSGRLFLLHAYGDSMIDAGIEDGDFVVVTKQSYARNGDLVVVYVEGEGNTLKRFFLDEKNRQIILHPENNRYRDIIVKDCQIQGVVTSVIKNVHRP